MTSDGLTFGAWLRQRRKELGITQEELADRVGFSRVMLWKIEAGERRPSGQIAQLLADFFHIPADERIAFTTFARTGRASTAGEGAPGPAASRAPWRAVHLGHTNLPTVLTPLVGREQEAVAAREHLLNPRVRLLTLTGAPGIGKTRLTLRVAADLVEHFEDGVYLADLAPIMDPELVLAAVARTLGLKEARDRPIENVLLDHVRERRMLLVLDNFEQILDAAPAVVKLLEANPWLKVLVTSREALHVQGEQRFAVPPLGIPDPALFANPALATDAARSTRKSSPLDVLAGYPAVQLFVARARAITGDFALTAENGADVAAMCAALEGLPLAIELAAARTEHLSAREIRSTFIGAADPQSRRSNSTLQLLTGGARDLPPRQRTLMAAIEWSYNLLDEPEQVLFRRLGVFVGGFTPEAVEAVASQRVGDQGSGVRDPLETPIPDPRPPTPYALLSLLDKNLLSGRRGGGQETSAARGSARFRMLEAIRAYALDRLIESDEADAIRLRHARYFLDLAREADSYRNDPRQVPLFAGLDDEHDNVRSALGWLIEDGRDSPDLTELALRIVVALAYFWNVRGLFSEAREWLTRALRNGERVLWNPDSANTPATAGSDDLKALRASALEAVGRMSWVLGDYPASQESLEHSMALREELGDRAGIASALNNLATLSHDRADYEEARSLYERSLALAREVDDRLMAARVLNNLGNVHRNLMDPSAARRYYEESIAQLRDLGDRATLSTALGNLSLICIDQEDFAAARRYQEEVIQICRELDHKQNLAFQLVFVGIRAVEEGAHDEARAAYREALSLAQQLGYRGVVAMCLEGVAALGYELGRLLEAARLWGAAGALREAINYPRLIPGRRRYEQRVESARAQVEAEAFEAAWQEGRAMPTEDAVQHPR